MIDPRRMRLRLAMAVSLIAICINIILISSGVADGLYADIDYSILDNNQQTVLAVIRSPGATN